MQDVSYRTVRIACLSNNFAAILFLLGCSCPEPQRARHVGVRGLITEKLATDTIRELEDFAAKGTEPIRLEVDSEGGEISSAIALVAAIKDLDAPVQTHTNTGAGGISAFVVSVGKSGERSASSDAVFAGEFRHLHAGLGLLKDRYDLLFLESLLLH